MIHIVLNRIFYFDYEYLHIQMPLYLHIHIYSLSIVHSSFDSLLWHVWSIRLSHWWWSIFHRLDGSTCRHIHCIWISSSLLNHCTSVFIDSSHPSCPLIKMIAYILNSSSNSFVLCFLLYSIPFTYDIFIIHSMNEHYFTVL